MDTIEGGRNKELNGVKWLRTENNTRTHTGRGPSNSGLKVEDRLGRNGASRDRRQDLSFTLLVFPTFAYCGLLSVVLL